MFDEDVAPEPELNQEHCKHSPAPASTQSWPKQVATSMHAFTTTRQLLQEVRDLHKREDVPQQSKRRRVEDIKSQAVENLLTGIVEANIEMHELCMHELCMHEHRE